jgi:hypothetical protein
VSHHQHRFSSALQTGDAVAVMPMQFVIVERAPRRDAMAIIPAQAGIQGFATWRRNA